MTPAFNPVRLALYYAAYFAVIGILLPFWPLWLKSKGLEAVEIGIILGIAPYIRGVTSPLFAHIADRRGIRKPLMVFLAFGAVASFALYQLAASFWPILIVTIFFFMFFSATQPLGESLTMHIVRSEGSNYGRIRLWGSITFILAAILVGRLLEESEPSILYTLSMTGIVFMAGVCLILPRSRMAPSTEWRFPIVPILKNKLFVLMMASGALIQSSHAVMYTFGTIHWESVGYSDTIIGLLWAEGVIAEIILFQYSSRVMKYLNPSMLLIVAGLAGVIRWFILGTTDDLPTVFIAQVLHGITFGAAHLGAIHYISENIPPSLSATAQSLYSSVVMGFAIGTATMFSGQLYAAVGGQAYFLMAIMAAVGGLLGFILMRQSDSLRTHTP